MCQDPAPSPEVSCLASNGLESHEPELARPRRARHAYPKVQVTGCDGLSTQAYLTFEDPCDHGGKVGKYSLIARSQQDGTPTFELQLGPSSMLEAIDTLLEDGRLQCGKLFEPQTGFQQLLKFESEDEFEAVAFELQQTHACGMSITASTSLRGGGSASPCTTSSLRRRV